MDTYYRKTRRPIGLSTPLKRPANDCTTPPKSAKIIDVPSTPKNARLTRPQQPPPIKKKQCIRDIFESVHQQHETPRPLFDSPSKSKTVDVPTDSKIESGPLKGLSTTLLDKIRAKEAAANATTPEIEREKELLGIAPEIVRVTITVFTASKKDILPYERVVDKCHKGLKSAYTSKTIVECLHLLDKIAPEWVSVVDISRGKFMRINKNKYTRLQIYEAIKRYKKQYN